MRCKWMLIILTVCILAGSAVSCKALPRVPEGAEDCPIWESEQGMVLAGIIDGTYPVKKVYCCTNLTAAFLDSAIDPGYSGQIAVQAAIDALREIEPHILQRIESDTEGFEQLRDARYFDQYGYVLFVLKNENGEYERLNISFSENQCCFKYTVNDEQTYVYYLLDTDAKPFLKEIKNRLEVVK